MPKACRWERAGQWGRGQEVGEGPGGGGGGDPEQSSLEGCGAEETGVPGAQPRVRTPFARPPQLRPLVWPVKPGGEGDSPARVLPPPCAPRMLEMDEFFPETYRLDIRDERQAFLTLFDGERPLDARPALGRRVGGWGMIRSRPGPGQAQVRVW